MHRAVLSLILGAATVALPGCCLFDFFDLGPWGGPGYTIDSARFGTGEQVIVPRNDEWFMNGEPLDMRSGHSH